MVIVRSRYAFEVWLGLKRIWRSYPFTRSCYPFPEWPFPLLLLLFLVFSLARPNKKELLQKESFLSETLLLLVFPSVFPRPAQQERITLKRKKRRLTITKAFGTPPPVGNRISYYQPGPPAPPTPIGGQILSAEK